MNKKNRIFRKKIKTLIVDDHLIVCQALERILSASNNIEIVGFAHAGHDAMLMAADKRPDLVIMDIKMPIVNGLEATRGILNKNPNIKIIVYSGYGDVHLLPEIIKSGASAYLLKSEKPAEFFDAIDIVLAGGFCLGNDLKIKIANSNAIVGSSIFEKLSSQERNLLKFICDGKEDKETANAFGISPEYVRKRRNNIYKKTGTKNRAQLMLLAIKYGLYV